MTQPTTLYLPGKGPLHQLNPLTKLTLSLCFVAAALGGPGYWLATLLFLFGLLPLAVWGGVARPLLRRSLTIIAPLVIMLFFVHGFFNPDGVTPLFNLGVFTFTREGAQYAYWVASRLLIIVTAAMLLLLVTHPGHLMAALTSRGLPPSLAYILSSSLHILPQMQGKARAIMEAQRARGLETEGSLLRRARALPHLLTPLVLGSLAEAEERAIALEARAFRAPGPKTIWRPPPDSAPQRWLRRALILLTLALLGAGLWL